MTLDIARKSLSSLLFDLAKEFTMTATACTPFRGNPKNREMMMMMMRVREGKGDKQKTLRKI